MLRGHVRSFVLEKSARCRRVVDSGGQLVPDFGDDTTTSAFAELNDPPCRSSARTDCGVRFIDGLVDSFRVGVCVIAIDCGLLHGARR